MYQLENLQKGKCKHCGLIFKEDDILEIDYFLLNNLRKKRTYQQYKLLHKECGDTETRDRLLEKWKNNFLKQTKLS